MRIISVAGDRAVMLLNDQDMDTLVQRHQSWGFTFALRMVWRRGMAGDATQEILIKAVTKLSIFAGNRLDSAPATTPDGEVRIF